MNRQMKNTLVGILVLLLAACGQFGTAPAEAPEPIVTAAGNTASENVPTAVVANGSFSKYIGLNFSQLPEGLSESFALLIQGAEDHSLSLVSDGENKMLWLSKMTHRDSNGNAFWEVKDILELSNVGTGLTLIPDGCSLNGAADSEIVVAGADGTIQLAWRADTRLDKFEVIPVNGIECHSDKGMGLE